jgi:hypothetical protein
LGASPHRAPHGMHTPCATVATQIPNYPMNRLERAMGFEPTTPTLKRLSSSPTRAA